MGRMSEGAAGPGGPAGGTGAPAGDWRLLPIPLWDGEHLRQLRLFLRQHEGRDPAKAERARREATRFILELEMSRLGEMQLDGLVRDRRFDLMLRTRDALPEHMRREIRTIFDQANEAAGYSGKLGFQASSDWHFLPLEAASEDDQPSGVVV